MPAVSRRTQETTVRVVGMTRYERAMATLSQTHVRAAVVLAGLATSLGAVFLWMSNTHRISIALRASLAWLARAAVVLWRYTRLLVLAFLNLSKGVIGTTWRLIEARRTIRLLSRQIGRIAWRMLVWLYRCRALRIALRWLVRGAAAFLGLPWWVVLVIVGGIYLLVVAVKKVIATFQALVRVAKATIRALIWFFKNLPMWVLKATAVLTGLVYVIIRLGRALNQFRKPAVEFEKELRRAAAVGMLTAEEIKKLGAVALSTELTMLGVDATEAAKGLWFLLSAGLKLKEVMQGSVPAARLAIVLTTDLETATALLTATMSTYHLSFEHASKVVDIFAGANALSMANVEKLQYALRYAGPVAAAFGWDVSETVAVLMQFFNAGLRGEQAGTVFRGGLVRLANQSRETSLTLERLGLSSDMVARLVTKPLELIRYLATAQWDAATAAKVFGNEAMQWTIVLNNGVSVFEDYYKGIERAGIANKQIATQMDTWSMQMKVFHANWKNIKTIIVEVAGLLNTKYLKAVNLVMGATLKWLTAVRDEHKKQKESWEEVEETTIKVANRMIDAMVAIVKMAVEVYASILEIIDVLHRLGWAAAFIIEGIAKQMAFAMSFIPIFGIALATPWIRLAVVARMWQEEQKQHIRGLKATIKAIRGMTEEQKAAARASGKPVLEGWGAAIDTFANNVKLKIAEVIEEQRKLRTEMEEGAPDMPTFTSAELDKLRRIADLKKYIAELKIYRAELEDWFNWQKALHDDSANQAMLELSFREKDLEQLQRMEWALSEIGEDEEEILQTTEARRDAYVQMVQAQKDLAKEQKKAIEDAAKNYDANMRGYIEGNIARAKAINDMETMAKWEQKLLDYLRERADLAASMRDWEEWGKLEKEISRLQQERAKRGHQERMQAASDYESLQKKVKDVDRAVQLVIGGRLGEGIKEKIEQLYGAGVMTGRGLFKSVKALGGDKIILELRSTQVTPELRDAIIHQILLPALQDADLSVPAR